MDGISLIPKIGIQTQKIPPIISVKDKRVNSAAGKNFEPIEYKIKPMQTIVPCKANNPWFLLVEIKLTSFLSGLIIGVSVFFIFGVEQIAYPAGSIKFKATGIARSLGIILFSMVPALIFYIVEDTLPKLPTLQKEQLKEPKKQKPPFPDKENLIIESEYNKDEWEEISEEELSKQEFEVS